MTAILVFIIGGIIGVLVMSVRVIAEYERAVIFRLGRVLHEPKGPGLIFLIPAIDKMVRVSVRVVTMDIEPQDVISRDNVSLKVNAVLYFRVVQPIKAIVNVENFLYATSQVAQTHLRTIVGEHTLDELLTARDRINTQLQRILDQNTDPWGVKVEAVEMKQLDLPPEMLRAMAREAESERERRAKVISAEGEMQSAGKLREAADLMAGNQIALQLRYLQTLFDISSESTNTIILPLPMELISSLVRPNQTK
ncbi:MAG: SPFH domain-containing protein [Proteobacteria bacterium]|nr:SPFH domain-containing protein [Pseudomonadota bacterium]